MPNLALSDLQHLNTLDPSGRLLNIVKQLEAAHNNMALQVNAPPVGSQDAPPNISAVTAVPLGDGHADVSIQDNNFVTRGVQYFAEYSTTQAFSGNTTKTYPMGPSKNARIPVGSGQVFVRAYSAYATSPPSEPVYHSGSINAGGTFAATAGNPGAGSGTESSQQPQTGAGFGFTPSRPLPRT